MTPGYRQQPFVRLSALVLALSLLTSSAGATQWVTFGPRALGMGGAHVAIAEGPVGAYYNPGALGQILSNPSGIELPAAGRFEIDGSVLEGANDFYEVAKQCRTGGAGTGVCTNENIRVALAEMQSPAGEGAHGEAAGGLNMKFGRAAFFANNFSFRGLTPEVDNANTTTANISNNSTKLHVRGGSYYEFGFGYGHEIFETGLFLGGNIKGIVARTGYTDLFVARENPEAGAAFRNFDRSTNISFMPGVDVGLLWDARESFPDVWGRPRVGFVGRNVNNPRFDRPARARDLNDKQRFYDLQGQSRVGIALDPFRWWTIAADLDLTENLTMVERYTSRLYSAGMEFRPVTEPSFQLALRGGVQKNIAQGNSGTIWSMGMGFHLLHFALDFAAAIPERFHRVQTIGGTERVPHQLALSAQLALHFGGAESISEPTRDPFAPTPRSLPRSTPRSPTRDPFRR